MRPCPITGAGHYRRAGASRGNVAGGRDGTVSRCSASRSDAPVSGFAPSSPIDRIDYLDRLEQNAARANHPVMLSKYRYFYIIRYLGLASICTFSLDNLTIGNNRIF